ncbi:MAG: hypothetical protein DRQ78_08995 [Epsilonproteobacteria bacterium]|nr:MAG: hypothetical protein DRQ78_08995 [Campylobacterota bacterium]
MEKGLKLGGIFYFKCFDEDGNLKWETQSKNLVVDEGLISILETIFTIGGTIPETNYYIGLCDGTPSIASTDTLAAHPGWVEVSGYTEAARQEFVEARIGLTVDNSANKSIFSINASNTVGGAFIGSVSTGSTGLLLSASAFANGDKSVTSGDTIEVQYDFSASST